MKYSLSLVAALFIALLAVFLPRRDPPVKDRPWLAFLSRPHFLNGLALLLLLVGAAVRLYAFGLLPAGVFVDEAILGYDAYSLLHYGIDHNGLSFPVHLPSFGSGQHALYAYLSMPFIALLGLNPLSIRLVNLVFGLVSLAVFYLLVRRTDGQKTALAALFLLAVNPWHIMVSRWGLECNLFPAVFLLATYFLVRWLQGGRTLALSMLLYGLSLYTYGTAYFVVPLFLLGVMVYLRLHGRLEIKKMLGGWLVLFLAGLPAGLYVAVNTLGWSTIRLGPLSIPRLPGSARFSQTFSLFSGADLYKSIATNVTAFAHLMTVQNDGNLWNGIPGFGFIYLFAFPLILCGAWAVIRQRRERRMFRPGAVHLFWLAAALLLALLVPANINRINILFLPLIYLAARALVFVAERSRPLVGVLVLLWLAWFGLFVNAYFRVYPPQMGAAFNQSLGQAIQEASDRTEGTVYITREVHLPYAYVLFYEQPSPHEFLDTVVYIDPGVEFRDAVSFGRYRFVDAASMPPGGGAYVVGNRELELVNLGDVSISRHRLFSILIPTAQ